MAPRKRKSKWEDHFSSGDRFGKWSVVDGKVHIPESRKEAQILCRCECGTEQYVWALHLVKGNSKSCGCSNHDRSGENHAQFTGCGEISGNLMNTLQRRAETRGHTVEIEARFLNDLLQAQTHSCAISGLPISPSVNASVDRINNTMGYVSGNVQWVHKDVNIMKNGYSANYFIGMCHQIAERFPKPDITLEQGDPTFKFGQNKK